MGSSGLYLLLTCSTIFVNLPEYFLNFLINVVESKSKYLFGFDDFDDFDDFDVLVLSYVV